MAVYKRTYKAYSGPLTPAWSRFTVLSRYGLATLFDSRPFTAFSVLCLVPFLIGLGFIYYVHSSAAQILFGMRFNVESILTNGWFFKFLSVEAWLGYILATWSGPGMITKDFANHSMQLYLSRPLSRTEYLFGKVSVLGILLSCTTWIPALVLFFVHAQLQGKGWFRQNLWMAGSILLASILVIALVSLLSMTIGVWVKWRIAATALMLASFILLPILGTAVNAILRTNLGHLIDLPVMMAIVWSHLFRMDQVNRHFNGLDVVPLWAAWASLLSVCALCFWLLDRKLLAREVERS